MTKHKLIFDIEYDFSLIGISCHQKDYRLCWAINNALGFNLKKTNNLVVTNKTVNDQFARFIFSQEEDHCDYELIANHGENAVLIPHCKQYDYFLKIGSSEIDCDTVLSKLRKMEIIMAAYPVDLEKSKNFETLIY